MLGCIPSPRRAPTVPFESVDAVSEATQGVEEEKEGGEEEGEEKFVVLGCGNDEFSGEESY